MWNVWIEKSLSIHNVFIVKRLDLIVKCPGRQNVVDAKWLFAKRLGKQNGVVLIMTTYFFQQVLRPRQVSAYILIGTTLEL